MDLRNVWICDLYGGLGSGLRVGLVRADRIVSLLAEPDRDSRLVDKLSGSASLWLKVVISPGGEEGAGRKLSLVRGSGADVMAALEGLAETLAKASAAPSDGALFIYPDPATVTGQRLLVGQGVVWKVSARLPDLGTA
jgi:hypothetical protein